MTKSADPIVIIGAGIGGLSAAIHLAVAGHPVTILEQNAQVGGKMGRLKRDGFTWDTGPSVITMQPVLASLFAKAERDLADYMTLVPVDPITRYIYADGTVFDATRDLPAMAAQIEALNPADVEGFLRFLSHAAALNRITEPVFIAGDPPALGDILRVAPKDMIKVDAWRTMDAAIRRHVQDPHLRHLLRRYATYVGASPYQAPAVLNVIAHKELTDGVLYANGGIYTIALAYARLAQELGVAIETNQRVDHIIVDDTRAVQGVLLEDGTTVEARAVVANVDVTTVYDRLLPPSLARRRLRRLARREPSLSGFVMLLGLQGRTPNLVQHNILFPADYRKEFQDIFQRGIPPVEPTIYISISARQDAEHAPVDSENWFILVNAPPLGRAFDWQRDGDGYRSGVLATLAHRGFDVRSRILTEAYLTPEDLARRTGAWRGSLYGSSSNQALNALRRPPPRDRTVRGLYFAGGTTHPGGGVPMVTLSGGVAARMLQQDIGRRRL